MKKLLYFIVITALVFIYAKADAQKIKTTEGSLDVLKNETSINIEFNYDKMSVGKYDDEKEYVKIKTEEYNKKEVGKGDKWAQNWVADRSNRYEPKFIELFTKNSDMTISKDAKYTLVFKTTSIEPGFNIGITRKDAKIDAEVWIVETADKSKKIATLTVDNAPGGTAMGYDFDSGQRISEAYAISGKKLAKYIK